MTIEEMKRRRKELGYSYREVSEVSGVPLGTVQKVLGGATKSPRYKTLCALERALYRPGNRTEKVVCEDAAYTAASKEHEAREPVPSFCYPGIRSEIIFGNLYQYPPSSIEGRLLIGRLYAAIAEQCRALKADYALIPSPVLDLSDNKGETVTVPDFCLMKREDCGQPDRIARAPFLVVELLSPQAKADSVYLKAGRYAAAGVKLYWCINLEKGYLQEHLLYGPLEDGYYSFKDVMPIYFEDAVLEIDLAEICRGIV